MPALYPMRNGMSHHTTKAAHGPSERTFAHTLLAANHKGQSTVHGPFESLTGASVVL